MQYFEQAIETGSTTQGLLCTLYETQRFYEISYYVKLTNDLTKVSKVFLPFNLQSANRFNVLVFKLVYTSADEDLDNGLVHFEPTGSYTYSIHNTGDNRVVERGKAIIYPNGEFSTAHKFGDEVNYTEHSNPTTNTVYIQA